MVQDLYKVSSSRHKLALKFSRTGPQISNTGINQFGFINLDMIYSLQSPFFDAFEHFHKFPTFRIPSVSHGGGWVGGLPVLGDVDPARLHVCVNPQYSQIPTQPENQGFSQGSCQ